MMKLKCYLQLNVILNFEGIIRIGISSFSLMQNSTVIVPLSNQKMTPEFAVECHQSQKAIPWEAIGFRLDFHLDILPDKADENNGNEQGNCLSFHFCYQSMLESNRLIKPQFLLKNFPDNEIAQFCEERNERDNKHTNREAHGIGITFCRTAKSIMNCTIGMSFSEQILFVDDFREEFFLQPRLNLSIIFGATAVALEYYYWKEANKAGIYGHLVATITKQFGEGKFHKFPMNSGKWRLNNDPGSQTLWLVALDAAFVKPDGSILMGPLEIPFQNLNHYFRHFHISHPPECRLEKRNITQIGNYKGGWSILVECHTKEKEEEKEGNDNEVPNWECGQLHLGEEKHALNSLISEGTNVDDPRQYPWMVAIKSYFIVTNKNGEIRSSEFQCSGSIIGRHHVLTAGHCLFKEDLTKKDLATINAIGVVIYAGQTFIGDANVQIRLSNTFQFHDNVAHRHATSFGDTLLYDNDIAIIHLLDAFDFNERVLPICLPPNWDGIDVEQASTIIAGWGYTDEFDIDNRETGVKRPIATLVEHLHKADARILPTHRCLFVLSQLVRNDCKRNYDHVPTSAEFHNVYEKLADITSREICVEGKEGANVQMGDSGSPLMFYNLTNGRWYALGILSTQFIRKDKSEKPKPANFINVSRFYDWILNGTQNEM